MSGEAPRIPEKRSARTPPIVSRPTSRSSRQHPRLHDLTLTLATAGGAGETIALRVGFRDVVVVGNRVLVNGHPIKAHGTTRHEAHPLVGRSLWTLEPAGKQWERDILTFRDTNINYLCDAGALSGRPPSP